MIKIIKDQLKLGNIVKYKNRRYIVIGFESWGSDKYSRVYTVAYHDGKYQPETRTSKSFSDDRIEELVILS